MYILAIFLLSIFAFLEVFNKEITEKNKYLFAFICYAFLVFHDGLRWETGSDWIPYNTFFEGLTISYDLNDDEFDIGYVLFNYIIRIFTDSYTVFLVIYASVFYAVFFTSIFKLSKSPFVSLLLFYMITVPYLGMNRQFLAMAIFIVGLVFLTKGKKLYFFLIVLFSLLFHKTVLFGLLALFVNKRISNKILLSMLVVVILISLTGIVNELSLGAFVFLGEDVEKKMDFYTLNADDISLFSTALAFARKFMWIAVLMFFNKKIEDKPPYYYMFFNLYFIGSLIYILFNGTIFQIFVSRALLYYNLMEIFLIPYVLTLLKPNYGKLVVMFVLVAYCYINIEKGFSNYGPDTDYFEPYKGIFINTDYDRQYQ
jgi:hypothetical protein